MEQKRFSYLFQQYFNRKASATEREEFFALLSGDNYDDQLYELIDRQFESFYPDEKPFSLAAETRMLTNITGAVQKNETISLWSRFAMAAAVAVIILSTWVYNSNKQSSVPDNNDMVVNDIAPGSVSATLTLANGKKLRLSDAVNGELAKELGVIITKSTSGQLIYEITNSDTQTAQTNVLTTAKGETYQVRLPDGTLVFLNAGSSLKYPTSFAKQKNRIVSLTGEGYFEVSKDKIHPFIVETRNQRVEVLGTHFNINSYVDEPAIKTTLLEGTVKVAPIKATSGKTTSDVMSWKILKPGDQASVQNEKLTVHKVDMAEAAAWKNGEFLFDEDDFRSAMRKLARWYDVEIIYAVSAPEKFKLGGFISRDKNISAVLKLIELTGDVHFIIEGRRITVTK